MQREIILQADKIGKYFYDPVKFKVLNEISFNVFRGEFVTLVGKSGSGKRLNIMKQKEVTGGC